MSNPAASRVLRRLIERCPVMNCLLTLILGVTFMACAFVGAFSPDFMSMALSPTQVMFLFFGGIVALSSALRGAENEARWTCSVLGVMYAFLGLGTMLSGAGYANPEGVFIQTDHVLRIIQGHFELTAADGVRNLLLGAFALFVGFSHWGSNSQYHFSDMEAS